ncbi:hypothetical protein BC941DRAFT_493188 [Chlamydoabsidia padenii]|nr:hypothetical protein BC941DRAFT_493188 [Chlamydoabsidia padenii]
MRHKQSLLVNDVDWDNHLASYNTPSSLTSSTAILPALMPTRKQYYPKPQYNTIFSDDEDDPTPQAPPPQRWTTHLTPSVASLTPSTTATYVDPLLSSGTYHIHQAENALSTLKHIVFEDGWKKALKHKSGVVVHMMNGLHKADKTPIFKGEAIIHGFSPQSIFYVIGMRKLWDEQYEDGNLVENLNDTTSLTYEVTKPTATSKPRDFALVERIECTQNGSIIFAATSVETPRLPRIQGRTRAQIKLQGWILEPVRGGPTPSTKVTFVIQENMKGWVPGFAKKSLARRPLVIALINDYLQKKSGRPRTQCKSALAPLTSGYSRRPSLLGQQFDQSKMTPHRTSPSPATSQHSILLGSNASSFNGRKRITFAEQDVTYPVDDGDNQSEAASDTNNFPTSPPQHLYQYHHGNPTSSLRLNHHHHPPSVLPMSMSLPTPLSLSTPGMLHPPTPAPLSTSTSSTSSASPSPQQQQQRLYPAHRHPNKKAETLAMIKRLSMSPEGWVFDKEKDGIRYYSNAEYLRADGMIYGGWTPEQLCSVTHCIGARKIWDSQFEHGDILERFSQKDYLVRWIMKNGGNYTVTSTIETDTTLGTIYTASASVDDVFVTSGTLKMRLYGWIFVPIKDDQGRRCVKTSIIWDSTGCFSSSSLSRLGRFLSSNGCPPYIRRVAGKVLHEELLMVNDDALGSGDDNDENDGDDEIDGNEDDDDSDNELACGKKKTPIYSMKYVVKHEPSHTYRARKSNLERNWCTDIRIHSPTMYPLGFDVSVSPPSGTRVDVTEQHIKIFTTTPEMEGKQVSVNVVTSHNGRVTCNGALMFTLKDIPTQHHILSTSQPETESSQPPINETPMVPENDIDQSSTVPRLSIGDIQVPKGYILVAQHQTNNNNNNNNIVIISEDLTFNGQQLAVMFIAMLLCYYMGKFACVCQ